MKAAMSIAEYRASTKKKKPRKKSRDLEHKLQVACVAWFRTQYRKFDMLLFSVPNGASLHGDGKQRAIQWNRLKAEGATPGAADLFLAIPSGDIPGLFIEMKTDSNKSKQSDKQIAFETAVLSKGYGYAIARTFEQFKSIITLYLEKGLY